MLHGCRFHRKLGDFRAELLVPRLLDDEHHVHTYMAVALVTASSFSFSSSVDPNALAALEGRRSENRALVRQSENRHRGVHR